MTAEEYRAILDMDITEANIEDLKDITKVRIDRELPVEERKKQYIKQVKNPYMVRVGNMKVKISFANNGLSMEEAFEKMLLVS